MSHNLLPALDSTGEARAKDKKGGWVSDPKRPWTLMRPRRGILIPLYSEPSKEWPTAPFTHLLKGLYPFYSRAWLKGYFDSLPKTKNNNNK